MAQFPVAVNDPAATADAINYLLSGPSGLGQNFEGFSAYLPAYIRPSTRQPWTVPATTTLNPSVYLDIPVNDVVPVGGATSQFVKFVFTTPQATAPFQYGDRIDTANIVSVVGTYDADFYNDSWTVYSATATDVTVVTTDSYTWPAYVSGGNCGRDYLNYPMDTECNAHITVSGATDQAFISAQLNLSWEYDCVTANDYDVVVSIIRNRGFQNNDTAGNDYLFSDPVVVSEKTFARSVVPGTGTQELEAIFTTVLDGPGLSFGYYWYILSVQFNVPGTSAPYDITIGPATTGLRSLTAQVIKQ